MSLRKLAAEDGGDCTKFELMIVVTQCEPPQLTADQINSPHFCNFVNRSGSIGLTALLRDIIVWPNFI